MELYTGTPYWPVKNKLWDYFNPLKENLSVDVVIVGAGITGALVAHEMLRYGIDCCVVDKRTPGLGSSSASTPARRTPMPRRIMSLSGLAWV